LRRSERFEYAIEEIRKILLDASSMVNLIVVEGTRDVKALRNLGYSDRIEVFYHTGITEIDFVSMLSRNSSRILILTDFDDKGKLLSKKLSRLFESHGVRLERELRRNIGKFMKIASISTIESLDGIYQTLLNNTYDTYNN